MNTRKREEKETEFWKENIYRFSEGTNSEQINALVKEYKEIIDTLISKKVKWVSGKRSNFQESIEWYTSRMREIKGELDTLCNVWQRQQKNILETSPSLDQNFIGSGKDSLVYPQEGNKNYVIKESIQGKLEELKYLKRKWKLLQTYLWDVIPKSYFIHWETKIPITKWETREKSLWRYYKVESKNITLQRRVNGRNLQEMTHEERLEKNMIASLQKAHKKYILLKMFVASIIEEFHYSWRDFDTQLDLWPLSNQDSFSAENIDSIDNIANSPNIMWDGKKIYFIDFWTGTWTLGKEEIYQKLMSDDVIARWKTLLKSLNLE